jgi:putative redox protein
MGLVRASHVPYPAEVTKHVTVRWSGGMEFEGTDEGGGASVAFSSRDEVFGPGLMMLAALGGCTGMDAISIMTKKRLRLERYQIDVVGEQREEHPRFFTTIEVTHIVEGHAIDDRAVARAIELSARKYCVVGANLAWGPTAINHRMRIIDEAGERTCDCLTIGPEGAGLSNLP